MNKLMFILIVMMLVMKVRLVGDSYGGGGCTEGNWTEIVVNDGDTDSTKI